MCWYDDYQAMYGMMSGGGESMMMAAPALMSSAVLESSSIPEKSIEEQILDLEDCIEILEKIWLEDPYIQEEIDPDDWKKFMDAVYESLYELKVQSFD